MDMKCSTHGLELVLSCGECRQIILENDAKIEAEANMLRRRGENFYKDRD